MVKSFGEKLKQARTDKKLKQSELANKLGITNTTVSNWENNISKPDLDMLSYICGVLEVKVSYFLESRLPSDEITIGEMEHIKKYRNLDDRGKEHVSSILEWESQRVQNVLDMQKQIINQEQHISSLKRSNITSYAMRLTTYYRQRVSAGTGEYLFGSMIESEIEIPDNKETENADFVIQVSGDSMEPTYYDGNKLLVLEKNELNIGDIGIFTVNNELFVKELGKEMLISHNKKYSDIIFNEDDNVRCIGKVLGKVEE